MGLLIGLLWNPAVIAGQADAAAADLARTFNFSIRAQRADRALTDFARQAGITLVFRFDAAMRKETNPLVGRYSLAEGLEILLKGTGLRGSVESDTRLVIQPDELSIRTTGADGFDTSPNIKKKRDSSRKNPCDVAREYGSKQQEGVMLTKTQRFFCRLAAIISVPVLSTTPAPVAAQENTILEEVVVTVRKRSESLQEVPIAVSAFTAADLSQRSLSELEDIALQTTGFNFESGANGGFGLPTIRGAAQFNSTLLETNVSVFIDGLYIPRQYAFDQSLQSVARVEIAKGPQNALFGRNAFMGAVNYVPKKPDLTEASFEVETTQGSDQRRDYEVSASIPVVEGKLGFRASWGNSEFDGTWNNPHPNANLGTRPGTNGNLGGWDREGSSLALLYKPSESISLDLAYYSSDDFNEDQPRYRIDRRNNGTRDELNCGVVTPGNPALHRLWCGELPIFMDRLSKDPRGYGVVTSSDIVRFGASWDITDAMTIDYVFGNIKTIAHTTSVTVATDPLTEDNATTKLNTSMSTPNGDFENESHEVRLSYGSKSDWSGMVGAYSWKGTDNDFTVFGSYPLYNAPGGTAAVSYHDVITNKAQLSSYDTTTSKGWAVFSSIRYAGLFDGKGRLTLEGRYNSEDKSLLNNLIDPAKNPAFASDKSRADQFNYFTPRVTFDYALADQHMVYGSVSKGVLSGGFNATPAAFLDKGFLLAENERSFDTSENWTLEIGSKQTLLDGRAQLNAAAYFIDWSNVQMTTRPVITPALNALLTVTARDRITQITSNLGDARIYGIEVDGTLQLSDTTRLNGGASYQDSRYKSGTISDRVIQAAACDDIVCAKSGNVGGNTLQRQAPLQAFAGVFWQSRRDLSPLSIKGRLFLRADVTYQSKQYTDELNTAWVGARTLANLSAGITASNWELKIWAKNLFDEKYINQSGAVFQSIDVGYTPTYGRRRTTGLTVSVNF